MKTKVEITGDIHQCQLKKGEKGYIDGYVRAADNRGYAVVGVQLLVERLSSYALYLLL